ncbi:hypothetical protein VP496E541_P0143 [Vibrio phage 496E54-1]|nr:hypothetical protein VP495E541_P0142 [Vibrio phage 495E54-1]CAH9013964.1 hypothetical protein VP496E541_P0143 [Vibrio phage 496E54-1]
MSKFKRALKILMSSGNDLEPELNKNLSFKDDNLAGKVETFTNERDELQSNISAAYTLITDLENLNVCNDSELKCFHVTDWVNSEALKAKQEIEALKQRLELLNVVRVKSGKANAHLSSEDNTHPFVEQTSFESNVSYMLSSDGEKLVCTINYN